jgi:hypothetical protein
VLPAEQENEEPLSGPGGENEGVLGLIYFYHTFSHTFVIKITKPFFLYQTMSIDGMSSCSTILIDYYLSFRRL